MSKIVIKDRDKKYEIELKHVVKMLARLYISTSERNLKSALSYVFVSLKEKNDELFADAGFVKKLLLLEGSGYVRPPVNLGTLYAKVADRIEEIREKNRKERETKEPAVEDKKNQEVFNQIEKGKFLVKEGKRIYQIDMSHVLNSLKLLYLSTREKNLQSAILFVKSGSYRIPKGKSAEDVQVETAFVQKLFALDASGYVRPPISLGKVYQEIAKKIEEKIQLKKASSVLEKKLVEKQVKEKVYEKEKSRKPEPDLEFDSSEDHFYVRVP